MRDATRVPADGRSTLTDYEAADAAWRRALARYLELARNGASAGTLRMAATAVHLAAVAKGRCLAAAS